MRIEHVAIWVKDLEGMKDFYQSAFGMKSNQMYFNPAKNFSSYFLSFDSGARIELMQRPDIPNDQQEAEHSGITHLAISVGSRELVDQITGSLREGGIRILSEPRTTGDGYYESVIADPEGNRIEITE